MSEGAPPADTAEQRSVLRRVLLLNALLAIALGAAGLVADSSSLVANALDNTSDTAVYALSLFAVGRSTRLKSAAATASGFMLLLFAVGVLIDVGRRLRYGAEPVGPTMMIMAAVAAAVNLWCLQLLKPLKTQDVNLRAAETFSLNDFASNGGILVAGALVAWTGRVWPDLLVGALVAGVAIMGGIEILKDARSTRRADARADIEGEGGASGPV